MFKNDVFVYEKKRCTSRFIVEVELKVAKAMLRAARPDTIKALCECALNVLKGNIKLTTGQKKKLTRYKNIIRALSVKKTSVKKRKAILQNGGLIGALLSPVLGVLGAILGTGRR